MQQPSERKGRNLFVNRVTSRIATVVALSAIVLAAACSDATGPTPVTPTPVTPSPVVPAAMIEVGNLIEEMTDWALVSVDDTNTRSNLQGILLGLKGHLLEGKVLLCQQDVTSARGVIGSLDDIQQVGLAPVGLALDIVDETLTNASK